VKEIVIEKIANYLLFKIFLVISESELPDLKSLRYSIF
jgi:hypothetical protein